MLKLIVLVALAQLFTTISWTFGCDPTVERYKTEPPLGETKVEIAPQEEEVVVPAPAPRDTPPEPPPEPVGIEPKREKAVQEQGALCST